MRTNTAINGGATMRSAALASSSGLGLLLACLAAAPAHAQDVEASVASAAGVGQPADAQSVQAQEAEQVVGDDIIVTGSRIARGGFTAPTPTTVVGAQDLERATVTNPADLLNRLPAFRASTKPSVTTVSQTVGANYLDLRGLGVTRTLTLVNGQRYAPSSITGQVDLNLIPTIMVERIDVVTGGASAAYGSDAVAGVVNLIYKRDVKGLQGVVSAGESAYGDNKELNVGLLWGTRFADDRGSFMIGGQYVDNDGGKPLGSRDWGRLDWNIIPNPAATAANGLPTRLLASGVRNSNQAFGGLIRAPAALAGTQFLEGGVPAPFVFGSVVGPTFMVGGSGMNTQRLVLLQVPIERYALTARSTFDIGSDTKIAAEYSFGHSTLTSVSGQAQDNALIIQRDNAFLPASTRAAMVAANANTITVGRRSLDLFPDNSLSGAPISGETTLHRGLVSIEGRLGGSWKYDAYYQHGESRNVQRIGLRIRDNWSRAIDAVVNPANGQIVCRATLSADAAVRNAAAGCVPFNIFGPYSRSLAAADYVSDNGVNTLKYKQDAAAFTVQGEPFSIWGGPVSVAFGAEYRRESAQSTVDAISLVKGYDLLNFQPISGVSTVKEVFVETIAPIASDTSWAKSLEFNGAVRYTDYSLSGGVTSWKAGLTYVPFEGVRFRATRSRDIRAPNLNELFSPLQGTLQTVLDPATNQSVPTQINTGGNATLKPEFADTLTLGVVISPTFLPGFQLSVDYFDIHIKGAITTLAPADIIGRCVGGATDLCSRVIRDSTGRLVSIDQLFENLNGLRNRGVDFELAYRRPLSQISTSLPGTLGLRAIGTYTAEASQDDGLVKIDLAGDTGGRRPGGFPRWSGTGILSYDSNRLSVSAEARFVSSGKLDALGTPQNININRVASRTYVNLSASYKIIESDGKGRSLELFGSVNNLFNVDPPVAVSPNAFPTNAILFDTIGQTFTAGLRFKL
ncbi:TonB-dependent receptor [Sphingomonas sp. MG17]|uniref:TonB-dependent receptor n=1 Tax=Sphingomonas tagetis TaxID=2949092 RepID=A0A9X2HQH7_9SPHN|nr:TonB-dependent receptor [Sphingomonas tagetis]MCP3732591.1 TonB-dependent receptor [Sphingomonas tagetis]